MVEAEVEMGFAPYGFTYDGSEIVALWGDEIRRFDPGTMERTSTTPVSGAVDLIWPWGNAWDGANLWIADSGVYPGGMAPKIVAIDGTTLAFALALALLTSLVFGIAPVRLAARTDIVAALKEGTGGQSGVKKRNRTLRRLAIVQLAVAQLGHFVVQGGRGVPR